MFSGTSIHMKVHKYFFIYFVIFYLPISQSCRSPSISSVSDISLSLSGITATFFLLFVFSVWLPVGIPIQDKIIYDTLGGTYKGHLNTETLKRSILHIIFKIKYSSSK